MGTNILLATVLLAMLPAAAQLSRKAPPDVEEALKARVNQFYTLFQDGKFRQAEALVAEESRDLFYNMSKVPIRGFRFEHIEFADDFQSASVLVSCFSITPRTASLGIPVPVTGKWKLANGQWFLLIEPRKTTPFGPMKFEDPRQFKPEPIERPNLETITTGAFQVEPQKLVFPRQGQEPVVRAVVVKNNLPGNLHLEIEKPDLPGLGLVISDKNVPPKSQVSFHVNYDPRVGKLSGTRELTIRMLPIGQTATIQLLFE